MREVAGVDDGGGERIGGVGVLAGRRSRSDGEIGGRAAWTYDGAAGEGVLRGRMRSAGRVRDGSVGGTHEMEDDGRDVGRVRVRGRGRAAAREQEELEPADPALGEHPAHERVLRALQRREAFGCGRGEGREARDDGGGQDRLERGAARRAGIVREHACALRGADGADEVTWVGVWEAR